MSPVRTARSRRLHRLAATMFAVALGGCVATPLEPVDSSHYSDGRFHNIGTYSEPVATRDEWARHARQMLLGLFPDADRLPPRHVLSVPEAEAGVRQAGAAAFSVTWIGHATTLTRIGGQWVMTDPVLGDTIGAGPIRLARLVPPRPMLSGLPPIDVIVISHADHDHLDLGSLRRLARRNPGTTVYVPLATADLVRRAGFSDVRELDWFATDRHGDLTVQAVPAIHGVRRPPYRLNAMSWSGWILESGEDRLYFSGDTGYGSVFEEIRRRSGPVDVALVPIGAWSPRWFQEPFHVSPDQAAEIAATMGATTAIGIHWGTFPLSEEAPMEQRRRFLAAGGVVPRIGETLVLRR